MIAYAMNGEDLPWLNGYPVRLVVPGYYGTYWVKHLNEITVIDSVFDGFWMKSAYRIPDNTCACTEPGRRRRNCSHQAHADAASFLVRHPGVCPADNGGRELRQALDLRASEETPSLRPGPGVETAQNNCLLCHSADYVNTQPPNCGKTFWETEVTKKIKVYHAPINVVDAKAIADYLAKTH